MIKHLQRADDANMSRYTIAVARSNKQRHGKHTAAARSVVFVLAPSCALPAGPQVHAPRVCVPEPRALVASRVAGW